MLKRLWRFLQKDVGMYEDWSKEQLISRIKQLESKEVKKVGKVQKPFDFSKHNTRFIALRFAYLGWNYNGLNFQYEPTPLPTVEEKILQALAQAKFISEPEPGSCDFSRCGRTDKGVTAMNQVISLKVRSTLTQDEQKLKENDQREIPYIAVLNSLLPADIRITSVCLRPPPEFDARFSCNYRHYKYFILKKGLDLPLMKEAAKKYLGSHDFRNYCKIDGSKQISNYVRQVHSAEILDFDDDFVVFDLKGSAFLWHQVRYMVAVLLSVGQKLEPATIIDQLLDIENNPRKPNFEMANDIPLVLYDCVFDDTIEWLDAVYFTLGFKKNVREFGKFNQLATDYIVKANIAKIMQKIVLKDEDQLGVSSSGGGVINIGDGRGRPYKIYVPMMDRDLGEHYEVVNERHKVKRQKRDEDRAAERAETERLAK